MQRKPGFPVTNCSIKMPDSAVVSSEGMFEEDSEQQQRRLQLINFGHSQWGFNNWSWAVTKQDLDFVEQTNGKYTAGVVAFVSISVKSFEIHRENIGYATSTANNKGLAIYKSRKCAVTNALRETLLSFGGGVATDLLELPETTKREQSAPTPAPEPLQENNQNLANRTEEGRLDFAGMSEEEARAERKRRQRLAQEEFRQKQLLKHNDTDDKREPAQTSLDQLVMDMLTDPGHSDRGDWIRPPRDVAKREPSPPEAITAKRRASNKLDIVQDH